MQEKMGCTPTVFNESSKPGELHEPSWRDFVAAAPGGSLVCSEF